MIDSKRLHELRILMGKDYASLLKQVIKDLEEPLEQLRQAAALGQAERVVHSLHALRGVASNVGCEDLSAMCLEAEATVRAGRLHDACFAAIDAAIVRCREVLRHEIAAVPGS